MNFKPLLDRIIIEPLKEETDESGITIPKKYRQHNNKGKVVAIGDFAIIGNIKVPMSDLIAVGDICLYGEYSAEGFNMDGKEYFIVRIQDVRGVERG